MLVPLNVASWLWGWPNRFLRRMEAVDADLVLAVDTHWRVRYDGRTPPELDGAEKVICTDRRVVDVGKHILSMRGK